MREKRDAIGKALDRAAGRRSLVVDCLSVAGTGSLVSGVFLEFGAGWALIVFGCLALGVAVWAG